MANTTWQPQAYEFLLEENYQEVAQFYEQAIETEPDILPHYWHLGLAYLLQEQEEAAQTIWFFASAQATVEEIEQWTIELIEILEAEAQRQESSENYSQSWLIRGHIHELAPNLINNLLHLLQLDIQLQRFTPEKLNDWQVIELLHQDIDSDLLLQVLEKVLEFPALETVAFAEASLHHAPEPEAWINKIISVATTMAHDRRLFMFAADLTQVCLKFQPNDLSLLKHLFWFYAISRCFEQALDVAHQFYDKCHTLPLKVFGNYQILYVYMLKAAWLDLDAIAERHKTLLLEMIHAQSIVSESFISDSFIVATQPLLYLQDQPQKNRWIINQVSHLFERSQPSVPLQISPTRLEDPHRTLKIGYIGHTLRTHSVGWLSRWLFHHRDRDAFQVAIYLVNQNEDYLTQEWFRQKADVTYNFSRNTKAIAEQIQKDEIDILVDLDSVTHNLTCQVLSLKPAPIQVTWLGLDASGLPTIDYFIADPYVLPEDAQTYYHEKIWRLPQTYLAIDGFEVGVPTLRREHLDIPADVVVYLNVQNALKRHPDTIRLQMQIIKAVPNSYFLIKGTGDEMITKQLFTRIAQEEGVDPARLRFLKRDSNELVHRANLQIADVVLDTYPYNGATTTLEVLWMGIPLVTRVGQQFAARNSYTFMTNAGLSEGIAWSDKEYVEWGIRLGKNKALREQIALKLKASRQTSLLWNAQQFTKEMEKTYREMWTKYLQDKD